MSGEALSLRLPTQPNRMAGLIGSFTIVSIATFLITVIRYADVSHPTRFTAALLALLVIHSLRYLRLWLGREILMNFAFLGYALLSLSWTQNLNAAMITMPSLVNFTLVLILFGSFAAYHDIRALLAGMFVGCMAGAAFYSLTTGFPFKYPEDFSYNTIAGMYLFALFITLIFGAYFRVTALPLALAVVLLALIAATTSIKTNLGVVLGIGGSGVLYFKLSLRNAVRNIMIIAVLASGVVYGVMSNEALLERVQHGYDRVSLGLAVLTNREGDSGSIGLATRQGWKNEGLKGWFTNPVFGYGVEGFRATFGITSHSTPIDLLYNSGLIGCSLFYAMFASVAWRLLGARNPHWRGVRARIATILITYSFISLSGLIYYEPLVAIFVAVSSALIWRLDITANGESTSKEHMAADPGASITMS